MCWPLGLDVKVLKWCLRTIVEPFFVDFSHHFRTLRCYVATHKISIFLILTKFDFFCTLVANGLLPESSWFTLLGNLLRLVVSSRRPAAEHFWKRDPKSWWILARGTLSDESHWVASSGLPQKLFGFSRSDFPMTRPLDVHLKHWIWLWYPKNLVDLLQHRVETCRFKAGGNHSRTCQNIPTYIYT